MNATEARSPTRRTGFTIVEVLVSLVIVTVGLLGMAGASALSVRSAREAARESAALARAAHRLALLRSAGCAGPAVGSVDDRPTGMLESWSVGSAGAGFAPIAVRVEWGVTVSRRRAARQLNLLGAVQC